MTTGEKGKSVTVKCATNAAGTYILPMIIYPKKRIADALMENASAGAIGHCTLSGWTDEKSFPKWFMDFSSISIPSSGEKYPIILDGYNSHKTTAAVEYDREHGIELYALPPICTRKMQPLDKAFIKPLKSAYNLLDDTWMIANQGEKGKFFMARLKYLHLLAIDCNYRKGS